MEDDGASGSCLVVISWVVVLICLSIRTKCDFSDCVIIRAGTAYNNSCRDGLSENTVFRANGV